MGEKPEFYGSWKGRVIKSIAVDGATTWDEVRDSTGLSPKNLNMILKELYPIEAVYKANNGDYRVDYDLYKQYQEYFSETIETQIPTIVKISKSHQSALNRWIEDWKDVKALKFTLENKHFFLQGPHLDDFSKTIISKAEVEVLVVNPFVESVDLAKSLIEPSKNGVKVTLIRRSPNEKAEQFNQSLKKSGIKIVIDESVHAKLIVVDRTVVVCSSMNFISASVSGKSWEAGIVTIDANTVQDTLNSILNLIEMGK